MFIGNSRACNQMVSDADTLLLYITLLISVLKGAILIFRALKLKQRTARAPPQPLPVLLEGFLRVRARRASQLLLLFISPHIASLVGRQSVRVNKVKR